MFQDALPFWAARGYEPDTGRFLERLHMDGAPDPACPTRLRVQARQVYVYAHGALLTGDARWAAMARKGADWLIAHGGIAGGGWGRALAADGALIDPAPDTYDLAFALLALAFAHRLTGDGAYRDRALQTVAFMDGAMADAAGGYVESLPPALPRRQNPHMHLFEAYLAWAGHDPAPLWRQKADAMLALFKAHFFDGAALGEYFDSGWGPVAEQAVEPGHHYEWVWLLGRHGALTGADHRATQQALHGFAEAHGRNPATGLPLFETDPAGRPRRDDCRSWSLTEALKAHLALAEAGHDTSALVRRDLDLMFGHFLAGVPAGGWRDHMDGAGRPQGPWMPASSLYHLFLAFAELGRLGWD